MYRTRSENARAAGARFRFQEVGHPKGTLTGLTPAD
jgi:hypothetical protein